MTTTALIDVRRTYFSTSESPDPEADRMLAEVRDELGPDWLTGVAYKIEEMDGDGFSVLTDQWLGVFVKTATHSLRIEADTLEHALAGAYTTLKELAAAPGGHRP